MTNDFATGDLIFNYQDSDGDYQINHPESVDIGSLLTILDSFVQAGHQANCYMAFKRCFEEAAQRFSAHYAGFDPANSWALVAERLECL